MVYSLLVRSAVPHPAYGTSTGVRDLQYSGSNCDNCGDPRNGHTVYFPCNLKLILQGSQFPENGALDVFSGSNCMHRKTCLSGAPPSTPLQKLTTLPRIPRSDCERDSPPNTPPLTPLAPRTFKLRPPPLTCSTAVTLADECVRRGYSEIDVFCIWLWRIIHFKSDLQ